MSEKSTLIIPYKKIIDSYSRILGCHKKSDWRSELINEQSWIEKTNQSIIGNNKDFRDCLWKKMTSFMNDQIRCTPLLNYLTDLAIAIDNDDKTNYITDLVGDLTIEFDDLDEPAKQIATAFLDGVKIKINSHKINKLRYDTANLQGEYHPEQYDVLKDKIKKDKEAAEKLIQSIREFEKEHLHIKDKDPMHVRLKKAQLNCPADGPKSLKEHSENLLGLSLEEISKETTMEQKIAIGYCLMTYLEQIHDLINEIHEKHGVPTFNLESFAGTESEWLGRAKKTEEQVSYILNDILNEIPDNQRGLIIKARMMMCKGRQLKQAFKEKLEYCCKSLEEAKSELFTSHRVLQPAQELMKINNLIESLNHLTSLMRSNHDCVFPRLRETIDNLEQSLSDASVNSLDLMTLFIKIKEKISNILKKLDEYSFDYTVHRKHGEIPDLQDTIKEIARMADGPNTHQNLNNVKSKTQELRLELYKLIFDPDPIDSELLKMVDPELLKMLDKAQKITKLALRKCRNQETQAEKINELIVKINFIKQESLFTNKYFFKAAMTILKEFITPELIQDDIKNIDEILFWLYCLECHAEIYPSRKENADLFWGSQFEKVVSWYINHVSFFWSIIGDTGKQPVCPYQYFQLPVNPCTEYKNTGPIRNISADADYINYINELKRVHRMSQLTKEKKWNDAINLFNKYLKKSKYFSNNFQALLNLSHAYWNIGYYSKSVSIAIKLEKSLIYSNKKSGTARYASRVIERRRSAFDSFSSLEKITDKRPVSSYLIAILCLSAGIVMMEGNTLKFFFDESGKDNSRSVITTRLF